MDDELIINGMNYLGIEKRKNLRLEKRLNARMKDVICAVLNISNKGVLLETDIPSYRFSVSRPIYFELEIEGEWVPLTGKIKWIVSDMDRTRIGISIRSVPEVYLAYLKKLYIP
ncbi:MAG TPA: PilZ domain-containing protein [Candidatus Kapabacteria bacterium]|nr:PilZ domain-containing protein [Candidatus Kapabacteria bacterium]